MKSWGLILLLLVPLVAADSQTVDISINSHGIVSEDIRLDIAAYDSYSYVSYEVGSRPLSVLFDGAYTVTTGPESTVIDFEQDITPGLNTVEFQLLFDDVVSREGRTRIYSVHFEPVAEELAVTVRLPEGYILGERNPAVSPKPESIESDGRQLTLKWQEEGALDIIVIYEAPSSLPYWIIPVILAVIAGAVLVLRKKKKPDRKALHGTLGSEEAKVLELLRNGTDTQKALVKASGFSKSKMSKVVRKLEEKGAITKEPHFKTNKLMITKGWK